MDERKSDWNIGELYTTAWETVKNNKVLWVFGTALATFSYSFSSSSGNSNFDEKDLEKLQNLFNGSPATSTNAVSVNNVLGATAHTFSQTLGQIFASIPIYIYLILGLELVLVIIFWIVVSLIGKAWTEAGLLQGILSGLNKQTVTITDCSKKAFKSIKGLIWLNLIPTLLLMLAALVIFAILGFAVTLTEGLVQIPFIILTIIAVGAFIYWLVMLTLSLIWASRKVVYEEQKAKEALFFSYKIVKKKFWPVILLGLVNTILGFIIVGVIAATITGLIIGGLLGYQLNQALGIGLITVGALTGFLFISASLFISGLLTAFKAVTWSKAYLNIKGKYD